MKPWFREFVLTVVPAIIALTMVATSVYMMIWTEKEIPPFLINLMTIIIGYYFGMGANKISSSKPD
jgi:hypothetical protein